MDPALLDLLYETQTDLSDFENKERNFTHISCFGPHEKWIISPRNLRNFWQRYCGLVPKEFTASRLCLAERPKDVMPVIVDFTLKFSQDTVPDDIFSNLFLQGLTYCCQTAISELFEITDSECELFSVAMETHPWMSMEEIDPETGKNGVLIVQVRIQFPLCRIKAMEQKKILIPKICQNLRKHNIRSRMVSEPFGDWDKIINPDAVIHPVTMYGSVEKDGNIPLHISYCYGELGEESIEESIEPWELDEHFDPSQHQHCIKNSIPSSMFAAEYIDYWIPLFLSINYGNREILLRADQDANRAVETVPLQFGNRNREETDLELAEQLLTIVNVQRFMARNTWQYIGMALNRADRAQRGGLHTWRRLTEKYNPDWLDECESLYYTYGEKNITIKTIAWFAKEDNPQRYREWHDRWIMAIIEKAFSITHNDVAKAFYRCNWLDFVCCAISSRESHWFYYEGHRWIETKQAIELRRRISNSLVTRFEEIRTRLSRDISLSNDENFKSNGENNMKKVTKLISSLKNYSFKNLVLNESKEFFENANFGRILDANLETMGLNNGVIEIVEDKAIFRAGFPEDYISRYANVTYREDFTRQSKQVVDLLDWLGKAFPDPGLLDYFLKFAASCMKGGNADKIFPIWSGEGNNSKSMIIKLFEFAFGTYCINFPTSLLTGKQANSSAPTPELARSRNSRIAFLSEPDKEEKLKTGPVKKWTGGDTFFTRNLHDQGGDIVTSFKMIYVCNKISAIPDADEAVKNRVRIFPFLSKWSRDAPRDPEEQKAALTFKMDTNFDKKIQPLASAFIWLIVQHYPKYTDEGLIEPKIVDEHTRKFWDENDIYNQFINEIFENAINAEGQQDLDAFVTVNDAYGEFKDWLKENYPGTELTTRPNFVDELRVRKFGLPVKNIWRGIKMRERGVVNMDGIRNRL